ncbi:M14 family metallopeptidase [Rhizobium sp. ZPR3]|uniref:M14 family metallopeptidase n=2 Tax=unclassified Rhizobium TaxID=2613769 RepID=A0AAU7SR61_9HYPH
MTASTGWRAPLPPLQAWNGATETLIAPADDPWRTAAEADDFSTTPTYSETLEYLERLTKASPIIRQRTYGHSAEGRPLILVIASLTHDNSPGRARVFVECGIHPGEIDGKDAGLMLLRDIVFRGREDLLQGCDWYFVPVLSPDGHERRSPFSRPNQRGPEEQGWRASAQGLNLNRDFIKADSPEIRAILELINELKPDLFLDLHVTDGLDYQYDITFGFQDGPYSASPEINSWLETTFRSTVSSALTMQGHRPGPLILPVDDRRPGLGLMLPSFPPRFSHSYGDLRHLATVLVENHSLKPTKQRVLGTYALLEATLRLAGQEVSALRAATRKDCARKTRETVLTWNASEAPVRKTLFHAISSEFYVSPASGAEEVRWLGNPMPPVELPLYGSTPGIKLERPRGYWIPVAENQVIQHLKLHDIEYQISPEAVQVEVAMVRLAGVNIEPRLSERRPVLSADCSTIEVRNECFPAGSAYVPTGQPHGDLAIHLLEPACPDSLFSQGFISGMLEQVEYMESYVIAPMAEEMLASDAELQAAFEAKLAAEPAFAADPMARLKWFYQRSPYRDDRHMLYPIGRVIE